MDGTVDNRDWIKGVVEKYKTLNYKEQKHLLRLLSVETKPPPYSIVFSLDMAGMKKMAQVIEYCKENDIFYKPEKRGGGKKVVFIFKNLSERNTAVIGRLTL